MLQLGVAARRTSVAANSTSRRPSASAVRRRVQLGDTLPEVGPPLGQPDLEQLPPMRGRTGQHRVTGGGHPGGPGLVRCGHESGSAAATFAGVWGRAAGMELGDGAGEPTGDDPGPGAGNGGLCSFHCRHPLPPAAWLPHRGADPTGEVGRRRMRDPDGAVWWGGARVHRDVGTGRRPRRPDRRHRDAARRDPHPRVRRGRHQGDRQDAAAGVGARAGCAGGAGQRLPPVSCSPAPTSSTRPAVSARSCTGTGRPSPTAADSRCSRSAPGSRRCCRWTRPPRGPMT